MSPKEGPLLPAHLPYLLELIQEGVLVFPPASLLHPLLYHPVQDGRDSIGAHSLQQIQPAATDTDNDLIQSVWKQRYKQIKKT